MPYMTMLNFLSAGVGGGTGGLFIKDCSGWDTSAVGASGDTFGVGFSRDKRNA